MWHYEDPKADSEFTSDDQDTLDQAISQPEPTEQPEPTNDCKGRGCEECPGLPIVG